MSRRKANEVSTPLSLFPFIGVLLSTMGALLVVLIAVSRSAHDSAMRDVESERAAIQSVPPPADAEENARKLKKVSEYAARLRDIQAEAEQRLRDDQLRLSHAEDHMRRLQDQLVGLKAASIELDAIDKDHLDDRRQAEREVERLRQLIAETKATIKSLKETSATKKRSYAIIPYDGPNSTGRRPLYIECSKDEVILQPEGIRLNDQDFAPPLDSGNPLAAALPAAREQLVREANGIAPSKQSEPYPLILIRPDGVAAYYAVRAAIASWDADFGYEFVGDDWKLQFQPANPQLARLAQQAVDQARARRRVLAAAAPRAFRTGGSFSGDGFASGDDEDGGMIGGSGGYSAGGGGPGRGLSNSGSGTSGANNGAYAIGAERQPGASAGSGADRYSVSSGGAGQSAAAAGGSGRGDGPQNAGGSAGTGDSQRFAARGDRTIGSERASDTLPGTSGGPLAGPSGDTSYGPPGANIAGAGGPATSGSQVAGGAGRGAGGPSGGTGAAMASSGGDAQAGQMGSSAGSNMPGMRSAQPHAMPERVAPQDMAQAKGANWALGGRAAAAVPVRRSIQVIVRDDRIALLPDTDDQTAGGSEIKLVGPTVQNIDDIVGAVQKHISDWGMAGNGLYWRPVLVLNVGPDGGRRAEELAKLFKDSGIELRSSAVSQQAPVQTPTRR